MSCSYQGGVMISSQLPKWPRTLLGEGHDDPTIIPFVCGFPPLARPPCCWDLV